MAHFKRGKCRYTGKTRQYSQTFYRKRHGLTPIRIPASAEAMRILRIIGFRSDLIRAILDQFREHYWPDQFRGRGTAPRAHDIMHHNRPRRHAERELAGKVVRGDVEMDVALWPLSKRPKIYWD